MMKPEKIISGEMYYYFDGAFCGMRQELTLDHKVDGRVLKMALDRTQAVHPYLSWSVREQDGYFHFCETNTSATLLEGDKDLELGSEELDRHLIAFLYYGQKIRMELFHGLMDGVASKRVMETLLYFYFSIRDGREYDVTGIMTAPAGEDSLLFAEPFSEMLPIGNDSANADEGQDRDVFRFSKYDDANDNRDIYMRAKIPYDQFMGAVKKYGSTPTVLLSLLICHAILKMYPCQNKPIKINIPVNLRDALGCSATFRNATGDIALFFDPKQYERMCFDEQSVLMKKALKANINADNQRRIANKQISFLKMTETYNDYVSKKQFYDELPLPASDSVFISYIGKFVGKEYAGHILDAALISPPRDGILFNVYECGGYFNFTMIKKGSMAAFADAFCETAKELGMDMDILEEKEFSLSYVSLRENLGLEPRQV